MTLDAGQINREYYAAEQAGRRDYWRYMAAPRRRVEVLTALLPAEAGLIADLGCGDGALLEAVGAARPRAALLGVDLAAPQLEKNRARRPAVNWVAADLEAEDAALSAWTGRCDVVVASEVVEHMSDPARFLRRARSLAAPGGRLLLSTQSGTVRETERRVGHFRHFFREEMASLLAGAGWRPERVWNEGWPFHDLSKFIANLRPDAALREFSDKPYGPVQRAVCGALRGLFHLNSRRRGSQLFALAINP